MKITAIAAAGLMAGMLLTASPAHAELTAKPQASGIRPLQPAPRVEPDPRSEVQELLQQISDLDDSWDSLTPQQRQQRVAQLQQQVTVVDRGTRNLPADQQPEVQAMLSMAVVKLVDLVMKAQPPGSPCYFPFCLPGL
ncbi:hypothetical protein C3469_20000 [Mycobacterium kansasii]|uniref:hypothetical protein n=1 Tax=Mycobacterium kansasii TaxID=1768 RepID=UPI000CDD8D06|nr:hypothetical protein [Mycobacterium kansasii]POX98749.1 hypothetical protein C3479_21575 [Mycobacterium kansasii]POY24899.1 hypothetical protein C3469_20000 [Mycobacterium kansasii]POY31145.1 hypothetical protein C3478_18095 [Mycobacterium kansasii]